MPAPKHNTHAQKGAAPRPGHIHTRATAQAIADLKWLAAETGQSQGDVLASLLASERLRIENAQESAEVAERLQAMWPPAQLEQALVLAAPRSIRLQALG